MKAGRLKIKCKLKYTKLLAQTLDKIIIAKYFAR